MYDAIFPISSSLVFDLLVCFVDSIVCFRHGGKIKTSEITAFILAHDIVVYRLSFSGNTAGATGSFMTFSYKTVWQLAGPNILSNIMMVSVSFAHLWIVAPLGPDVSAAVVAGGRIHFLLMAAGMALSVATTALVARAWGARDVDRASVAMTASLWMSLYVAAALAIPSYIYAPVFAEMFQLSPAASVHVVAYIKPIALLNCIFALTLSATTAFRAIGDVMRPMQIIALTTFVSILSCTVLVHGLFGAPKMGVTGIPVGTALGQLLALVLYLRILIGGRYKLTLTKAAHRDFTTIRSLLRIGAPAAMEQAVIQISFVAFMVLVADYGTAAFAAYGIGITILSVCIVIGLGFGAASSALTGQAIGAGQATNDGAFDTVRNSGWAAMRLSIAIMTVLALIIWLFRVPLAALLSTDPLVRQHTEFFILILALIQPLMAIEFSIGGALRGAGDTRHPLFVSFTGMIVGRLSLGVLVLLLDGSIQMIYSVIIGDYVIKAAMLLHRFRGDRWISFAGDPAPVAVQSDTGIERSAIRQYYANILRKKRKDHD